MCRILAITGKQNSEFIETALTQFGGLAETGAIPPGSTLGHKDGWGLVGYRNGAITAYEREPASAASSPLFKTMFQQIAKMNPDITIGHLRKASPGMGSNLLQNTHPFTFQNYSFCHNGTVRNFDTIPLSSDSIKLRKGTTDSEWLFLKLIELRNTQSSKIPIDTTLVELLKEMRKLPYTAFNIIFSDGKKVVALREVNEKDSAVIKNNLCDNYYTFFLGTPKNGAPRVICSEKLRLPSVQWDTIKNHELVTIDIETSLLTRLSV